MTEVFIVACLGLIMMDLSMSQKVTPLFCADANCQIDWTPYPNMVAGLVGYDPVLGDPFHKGGDPGLKHQIFLPTFSDEETTRVGLQPFINAEDHLRY